MLPNTDAGLGEAKGRISIDVTSLEQAVQVTKRAAQQMTENLNRVNAGLQSRASVDTKRVEREAQAAIESAELVAAARSKAAADATKSVLDSLQRETKAAENHAKRVANATQQAQQAAAQSRSGLLRHLDSEAIAAQGFMRELRAIQQAEAQRVGTIQQQTGALQQQLQVARQIRAAQEDPNSMVGRLRQGLGPADAATGVQRERGVMPSFLQFSVFPLAMTSQQLGLDGISQGAFVLSGALGTMEALESLAPNIQALGKNLTQMNNVFGTIAGASMRATAGLGATASSLLTVGATIAPIIAVMVGLSLAVQEFQRRAEEGRESARQYANAVREASERMLDAAKMALGGTTSGVMGQLVERQMELIFARQDVRNLAAQSGNLQGRLDAVTGKSTGQIQGNAISAFLESLRLGPAAEEATNQATAAALELSKLSQSISNLETVTLPAVQAVERLKQPMAEMALRREFRAMTPEQLNERETRDREDLNAALKLNADLTTAYSAALADGDEILATVLRSEMLLNDARMRELGLNLQVAGQSRQFVETRARLQKLVEDANTYIGGLVDGIRDNVNRTVEMSHLLRSASPDELRDLIQSREDEAAAIRSQLPILRVYALVNEDAREQLKQYTDRLKQIGIDIEAFSNALPVAETRSRLQELAGMLRDLFPNLFPQSNVERLRGFLEGARDAANEYFDNVVKGAEARFNRERSFLSFNRDATPESLADRIQGLQDERAALEQSIQSMRLAALTSQEVRDKMAAMRGQQRQLGSDIDRLMTETLPLAVARAEGELITQINQIEREREAAIARVRDELARREIDINNERAQALADLDEDIADARADAARKHGEGLAKIEDDTARQREKILRRFAIDSQNAIANRDALAFHMAQQRRDEDLADLKARGEERKKELDKQLQDQNKTIDNRLADQTRLINRRYDDQLRTARQAAERQIQMERDRAMAEIAARRQAYQAQYNDLQNALFAEYAFRSQANAAIVNNAAWAAGEVNRILKGATGRIIATPTTVQVPQTGDPMADYRRYALSQGYVFQTGTNFVPRTGPALIHAGEGVINPETNAMIRRMIGTNYSQPQLAAAVMRGATGGSTANGISVPITVNGAGMTARQIVNVVDDRLYQTLVKAGVTP